MSAATTRLMAPKVRRSRVASVPFRSLNEILARCIERAAERELQAEIEHQHRLLVAHNLARYMGSRRVA